MVLDAECNLNIKQRLVCLSVSAVLVCWDPAAPKSGLRTSTKLQTPHFFPVKLVVFNPKCH